MKNLILYPLIFAGLFTAALFGSYRGTAVQDDFTWMIGGLVAFGLSLLLNRIAKLEHTIDELQTRLTRSLSE